MVIYVGQGDPEKSMRLLWTGTAEAPTAEGEPAPKRRGPKAALTVEAIVDSAVELADEGGIDAVSMRSVGKRLGKTPMALYTYVPGKAELIDLMWDRAMGKLPDHYDTSEGWRAALRRWAHDLRAWMLAHPWILDISGARAGMGPNETLNQEVSASLLDGLELPSSDLMSCVWSVGAFVRGNARALAETRAAEQATGVGENDWWFARSKMFDEVAPDYAERFPFLCSLAAGGAFDQKDVDNASYLEAESNATFEFGLERLLDGIDWFIQQHQAGSDRSGRSDRSPSH